jgi:hypothetical protein
LAGCRTLTDWKNVEASNKAWNRARLPSAETAVWGRFPESVGESPHLSVARGVGPVLKDGFDFELDAAPII